MLDRNSLLCAEDIANTEGNCNKCIILKMANIFPFGLENDYALESILNCENLKILEKLPSYEIISKAYGINSLDENIITNINSTYYPAHKFKTLNKNKSFNIFHTDSNELKNQIDQLQNFISTTTLNIGISTTTLNIDISTTTLNIDISTTTLNIDISTTTLNIDQYHYS